jgi:hypothetical protein
MKTAANWLQGEALLYTTIAPCSRQIEADVNAAGVTLVVLYVRTTRSLTHWVCTLRSKAHASADVVMTSELSDSRLCVSFYFLVAPFLFVLAFVD